MIKKIILFSISVILLLVVATFYFSHLTLDSLWFYSQGFLQGIIKASSIRIGLMLLFNGIAASLLIIFLQANRNKSKVSIAMFTPLLWVLLCVIDNHLQFSTSLLYLLLSGSTQTVDPLIRLDMAVYLFWVPTIVKGALYGISYGILWLLFRVFVFRVKELFFIDKLVLILMNLSLMIWILYQRMLLIKTSSDAYIGFMDYYGSFLPTLVSLFLIFLWVTWIIFRSGIFSKGTLGAGIFIALVVFSVHVLVPTYLDKFVYTPNKSALQEQFTGYHMQSMRASYALDLQKNDAMLVKKEDLPTIISNNFWEDGPHLLRVIQQNQEILPIFKMHQADPMIVPVDNSTNVYFISPRESANPSKEWDIRYFRNIFGYGSVVSSVNQFVNTGLPFFAIQDLELNSNLSNFTEKNPYTFFSDQSKDIALINTEMLLPDFTKPTYPLTKQKFPHVKGIKLNFFTKILLSIAKRDLRFFLTDYYNDDSQLLWEREPQQIAKKLLPIFEYSTARANFINNELWWELDAYALSDNIFNSQYVETTWGRYNWVRSPLKVFVSAYSGETFFKIINENDPYVKVAQKLYYYVFQNKKEIQNYQIRYPKELFAIQSKLLERYHDTDPVSFYSELKNLSSARTSTGKTQACSYRFLVDQNQISLQKTYTPVGKENLSAQLIGYYRGDGRYVLNWYDVPAEQGIPGMYQAFSFLNQNTEFSRLSTLWGQRGSKISFSDPTLYLMKEGGYYLQTVFLESEALGTPIVAQFTMINGSQVALASTIPQLEQNASSILSIKPVKLSEEQQLKSVLNELYRIFLQSETARVEGKVQEYQENVDKIGDLLKQYSTF